jgi:hypothetical protein
LTPLIKTIDKEYWVKKEVERQKYRATDVVAEVRKAGFTKFRVQPEHLRMWKAEDAKSRYALLYAQLTQNVIPMEIGVLTFEEMREQIGENGRVSVFLGNGFSRSWRDDPFRYETLFQAANFGDRDQDIRQVFEALSTQDFEKVTNRLEASRALLRLYANDPELMERLDIDAARIKDGLVAAITNTHPTRPNEVTADEYRHVREFLSKFTNYDLLMYWARNQNDIEPTDWDTDDGFREDQLWVGPETDQEVFFLHGALHLYDSLEGVKKHSFSRLGQPIIDKVQENLQEDIFPLFVSEPTSDAKLSRITMNPYLSYCLRKLRREEGALFIVGHGFAEIDRHIFDVIDHSNINHVYVAIHGDPKNDDNRRIRASAGAWMQSEYRSVSFVDAHSVPMWRGV